ncbi:MAG: lamin tail domain-containing protein [Verrucomicrobiales bacterium]|nr:lamin tail domain-containing protein [Verrucomicrobiales bacterium]
MHAWKHQFGSVLSCLLLAGTTVSRADTLVSTGAEWRWLKGIEEASQPDPAAWRAVDFDDSAWSVDVAPFWYGEALTLPGTELPDMQGGYTCVFLRHTFELTFPADVETMTLGAHSDDGFVAWINGHEVARFNMPDGEPAASGTSSSALAEPIPWQTFEIENARDFLAAGENVLAVQAFNASISGSSDFGIDVTLDVTGDTTPPAIELLIPPANGVVRSLRNVEVVFTEPVQGVDASDLRINGQPAAELEVYTARQYVFEFPEPPVGTVTFAWAVDHGITDLSGTAHPFGGGTWTCTLDPDAPVPGIEISEFMADNDNTLNDEDGDHSDWIELHNAGDTAVDLTGWHLTDDVENSSLWRLPAFTLAPDEYRIVFASGKDRTDPEAPLHTNFKLASSGGYLALTDRDGGIVSEFRFYPAQREDVSYGRDRFSAGVLGYFVIPTPGQPNATSGTGFAPPVEFSHPGGTFTGTRMVELSTVNPAAEIRFTLDGTIPRTSSTLYTEPIAITTPVMLRARSFATGLLPGDVRSEGYVPLAVSVLNTSSDLPLAILHNFGAGTIPAETDQPAWLMVFEPTAAGRSSLTNAPELATRTGINIRGSSTQGYPKSSYAVEAWDELNQDRKVSVLGMPAESDWVFYAPNSFEPVLIHNPFAHTLSRRIDRYSSRIRYAEVYVNTRGTAVSSSDYMGVYVIEEKIKRSPDRVDIDRLEPEHTTPPQVTGGYIMKIDRADANERTFYAAGMTIVYQDPPGPEIQLPQRDAQEQYIGSYLNAFGNALNGANFTDPVNGYRAYVDVPSWIDHHLLNVLTFNVDALRLSAWFYKPREGKLEFGPLWDFDRALGSTDGRDANPRIWRSAVGDLGTDFFNFPWWGRMFQDPDFWQAWIDRYQELRQTEFSLTSLNALVDELTNPLREAQVREVQRWPGHSPRGGSYTAEINLLKTWLAGRIEFMDDNFLDRPTLTHAGGPVKPGTIVAISRAAEAGSRLYYTLDGSDPRLPGGGISPDALFRDGSVMLTVDQNTRIVARCYNAGHSNLTGPNNPPISSPWSGAIAATYIVQTPSIVISEIMYHPAKTTADGAFDREEFEYVELLNIGETDVNLQGFRLGGGIDCRITDGFVLQPGARALIVANVAAFEARYGSDLPVAGVFTGRLDNAGDPLTLSGPLGEPILDFRYNDTWFPITDGSGFSLAVVNPEAPLTDWSSPVQWQVDGSPLGSPGTPAIALPTVPPVQINEALTHTDPPQVDTVELFNPGTEPADISGWFLTDDFGTPAKYRFPEGSVVPAGGLHVVTEEAFGAGASGFRLSSTGDELYLFAADTAGELAGYLHGFSFGAAFNGVSFGAHRNSQGREDFVAEWHPSLGDRNWGPRIGPVVISELMPQPAPVFLKENNTRDEYVELLNLSGVDQPLFDPAAPTNTWHLRGGIDFNLPEGLTLPPGGRLLLVNFDPALRPVDVTAFRAVYGLDDSIPLFGPYQGNLSNEGESVRLLRPDTPQTAPGPDFGTAPYVLVDEVDYEVLPPWPTGARGTGWSLQRSPEDAYGNEPWSWHAAAPTPGNVNEPNTLDEDNDGLLDGWERTHGLSPEIATGDDGPDGDPDGDRASNQDEQLAGTDPRDAFSVLRIEAAALVDGRLGIQFRSALNRTYRLQTRENLAVGDWQTVSTFPAGIPDRIEVQTSPANGLTGSYYRLVTP